MVDGFPFRQVQAACGALHHLTGPGPGFFLHILPGSGFFQTPERQHGDDDEYQNKQ
jgi:hypothetical protein